MTPASAFRRLAHLILVPEHSGTGLGPLFPVPAWFWHLKNCTKEKRYTHYTSARLNSWQLRGCTLHVHTTRCEEGYTLHVHTVGGGEGYTLHRPHWWRWRGIHPAHPHWWRWGGIHPASSTLVAVERDTPWNVHTAGCGEGYTPQRTHCWLWRGIHPARLHWWKCRWMHPARPHCRWWRGIHSIVWIFILQIRYVLSIQEINNSRHHSLSPSPSSSPSLPSLAPFI